MSWSLPSKKNRGRFTTASTWTFLAEDVAADQDVPAFDRSPYDGYAIRSVDSQGASSDNPVTFKVVGEIGAGYVFEGEVGDREAVRIMTGAPIPNGCDAVVMLELTHTFEEDNQPYMSIKRSYETGTNISYKGEDVQKAQFLWKRTKHQSRCCRITCYFWL